MDGKLCMEEELVRLFLLYCMSASLNVSSPK